jgi:hypothetical protein
LLPGGEIGRDFDDLWERSRRDLPIEYGVVRDASSITSRSAGHELLTLRDDGGRLRAYGIVRTSDGLLLDLLGDSLDSISSLVRGIVRQAARWRAAGTFRPKMVTAMETPGLAPVLLEAGFVPIRYRFGGFVARLSASLPAEVEQFGRWYLTGGD